MNLDFKTERKLMLSLTKLHIETMDEFDIGIISKKVTWLADIRDYFLFQTIRCESADEARKLIDKYALFTGYYECKDSLVDRFYSGFFFTLAQFLSLKYMITMIPFEKISYEEFEQSMKETIKNFNPKSFME